MKLQINKDDIYKAVSFVGKAVTVKPTTPVLGNILMETESGGLRLIGTDLETTIKTWVPAKILNEGAVTAPARTLIEFLASVADEKISLELEKESLVINTAKTHASVPTISASEFPTPPEAEKSKSKKIKKKSLLSSVKQVGVAASLDEGRPILTGVLFRTNKENTQLVATDGYRLAKKDMGVLLDEEEVIVPARVLMESSKILDESEDEFINIGISRGDNQAYFEVAHTEVFTKLLAGEFPKFEQIIPDQFIASALLEKEDFLSNLKTATTFAKDIGNVVHLLFSEKEQSISASSAQIGEGRVSLQAKVKGQDIKISFNSRFLAEGVGVLTGEKFEVQFADPDKPALIKSAEDPSFMYLVMPVRTQN